MADLEEHVLLFGYHVHVLFKVQAAEVHGLYQDVFIPNHLVGVV